MKLLLVQFSYPSCHFFPRPACSPKSSVSFLVLGQGLAIFLETGRKVNIFSLRWTAGRGKICTNIFVIRIVAKATRLRTSEQCELNCCPVCCDALRNWLLMQKNDALLGGIMKPRAVVCRPLPEVMNWKVFRQRRWFINNAVFGNMTPCTLHQYSGWPCCLYLAQRRAEYVGNRFSETSVSIYEIRRSHISKDCGVSLRCCRFLYLESPNKTTKQLTYESGIRRLQKIARYLKGTSRHFLFISLSFCDDSSHKASGVTPFIPILTKPLICILNGQDFQSKVCLLSDQVRCRTRSCKSSDTLQCHSYSTPPFARSPQHHRGCVQDTLPPN
jgi:hypothetical protein